MTVPGGSLLEDGKAAVPGVARYRRLSGKPLRDAEGRFRGYRSVATDITEQALAQESSAALN
jgi:PAS domain-containing protein